MPQEDNGGAQMHEPLEIFGVIFVATTNLLKLNSQAKRRSIFQRRT